MQPEDTRALDRLIKDLGRALARCDEAGVGLASSVYLDLALHLAVRERAGLMARGPRST